LTKAGQRLSAVAPDTLAAAPADRRLAHPGTTENPHIKRPDKLLHLADQDISASAATSAFWSLNSLSCGNVPVVQLTGKVERQADVGRRSPRSVALDEPRPEADLPPVTAAVRGCSAGDQAAEDRTVWLTNTVSSPRTRPPWYWPRRLCSGGW